MTRKVPLDRAKIALLDQYDPDELVDLLGITGEELLDAFEDKVLAYANGESTTPTQEDDLPFTGSEIDNE